MSRKTICIWDGCTVVMVVEVDQNGGSTSVGPAGGAGNSTQPDIDIDPWAGLIVERLAKRSPLYFRQEEE